MACLTVFFCSSVVYLTVFVHPLLACSPGARAHGSLFSALPSATSGPRSFLPSAPFPTSARRATKYPAHTCASGQPTNRESWKETKRGTFVSRATNNNRNSRSGWTKTATLQQYTRARSGHERVSHRDSPYTPRPESPLSVKTFASSVFNAWNGYNWDCISA